MSKLSKFEIELPAAPKSSKLSLSERDIAMATMYVSHTSSLSWEAVTVWECWEETRILQWLHLFPVLAVLLLQSTSVTALNKASKQPSWGKMGRGSKWRILMKLFWITTRVWRVFHFFS